MRNLTQAKSITFLQLGCHRWVRILQLRKNWHRGRWQPATPAPVPAPPPNYPCLRSPGKWKDLTLTGLEMVSVTEQALFPLFPQRMAECIGEWKLGSSCNDLLVPRKNSLWNVGGNVLITAWQYLWSDFVMPRKLHLFTYPLAISSHFALLT